MWQDDMAKKHFASMQRQNYATFETRISDRGPDDLWCYGQAVFSAFIVTLGLFSVALNTTGLLAASHEQQCTDQYGWLALWLTITCACSMTLTLMFCVYALYKICVLQSFHISLNTSNMCAQCGLICLFKTISFVFTVVMAVLGTIEMTKTFETCLYTGDQFTVVTALVVLIVEYMSLVSVCIG